MKHFKENFKQTRYNPIRRYEIYEFTKDIKMIRNIYRIISFIMLLIMIAFVFYALNNPQASFSFNNTITYAFYGVYVVLMIIFFVKSFKK